MDQAVSFTGWIVLVCTNFVVSQNVHSLGKFNILGEYQGVTNVTEYALQYNTPLNLTIWYTIVFLRHEYYRSMAIVSVGSASGL